MIIKFAERFMRLRQDQGFTQQKIAEKLGVTPQAVSKWENGASLPDAEMIRSIAQLMDCSTDYLLDHQVSDVSRRNLESVQKQTEIENAILKPALVLEVGIDLVDMLTEESRNNYALIHRMRKELGSGMGIIVPLIQMRDNITLGEKEYQILLHGKTVMARNISEYPKYFYAKTQDLPAANWHTLMSRGEWLERQDPVPQGYVQFSALDCILARMSEIILQYYDRILNRQLTADLVDIVRRRYPAAVAGVVPEQVSLGRLQRVIGGLVTAGVPVNRLDYIIGYLEDIAYCLLFAVITRLAVRCIQAGHTLVEIIRLSGVLPTGAYVSALSGEKLLHQRLVSGLLRLYGYPQICYFPDLLLDCTYLIRIPLPIVLQLQSQFLIHGVKSVIQLCQPVDQTALLFYRLVKERHIYLFRSKDGLLFPVIFLYLQKYLPFGCQTFL